MTTTSHESHTPGDPSRNHPRVARDATSRNAHRTPGEGLRIGEALGLRRADMHLLPDSRGLGCTVVGAHVHVAHRANPNGALAKSRFPRSVPASDAVLASYADYRW